MYVPIWYVACFPGSFCLVSISARVCRRAESTAEENGLSDTLSASRYSFHATMADNTCQSEYCNAGWGEVLTHMSPYGYANFGIAFGLGLSVVGAAWGIWLTGSSLVGAAVKAPRIRSKNLIRCVASVAKGSRGRYRDAVGGGTNADQNGDGEAKRGPPWLLNVLPPERGLARPARFCDKFRHLVQCVHRTNARRYSSTFHERERGEGRNEAGVVGLASKRTALEQNIMMGGDEKTFLLLQDLEFGMLYQSMPLFQFSFDSRLSYYISSILHGNAGGSFRWGMIIHDYSTCFLHVRRCAML